MRFFQGYWAMNSPRLLFLAFVATQFEKIDNILFGVRITHLKLLLETKCLFVEARKLKRRSVRWGSVEVDDVPIIPKCLFKTGPSISDRHTVGCVCIFVFVCIATHKFWGDIGSTHRAHSP